MCRQEQCRQEQSHPTTERGSSAVKLVLALALAVAVFKLVCTAIGWVSNPGDRVYDFFFSRGPVQAATLYVFSLALLILLGRGIHFVRNRSQLRRAERDGRSRMRPRAVQDDVAALCTCLVQRGAGVAVRQADELAERRRAGVRKDHESISFLAGLLPALGLFGTVLGLSNSLFAAFSGDSVGPEAIKQFVSALATALDTTVLAIACAFVVFTLAWVLGRAEMELADRQVAFVRRILHLDDLSDACVADHHGVPDDGRPATSTAVFRTELRVAAAEIAQHAKDAFEELLRSAVASYQGQLERSLKTAIREQRKSDRAEHTKASDRLADRLARSVDNLRTALRENHDGAARDLHRDFARLERALRKRTPEQVVLRFERNGKARNGSEHEEFCHA